MNNILITGGFGFLGSHLIDLITEREPDTNIYVIDNLASNVVNPKVFSNKKNINYFIGGVKEYLDQLGDFDFQQVYHLASIVGPAGVLPHSGKIARGIIEDTQNIASLAKFEKARLVFVSTSEVYGGGQEGYCSEAMPCIITSEVSARVEYAIGKLAAEISLINRCATQGLDAVIIRPFNIAGARQSGSGGFVLPRFLKAAQDNKSLTVFGDGAQVRAFTDVRDVANGVYLAMQRGRAGEVYNIGAEDNRITIKAFAELVIGLTDTKSKIEYVDPKELFGEHYASANDKFPDSQKARTKLGWLPKYSLDDIITSAVKERQSK